LSYSCFFADTSFDRESCKLPYYFPVVSRRSRKDHIESYYAVRLLAERPGVGGALQGYFLGDGE
jgi:hypothetical protein